MDRTGQISNLPVNVPASVFTEVSFIPWDSSWTVDFIETCSWIMDIIIVVAFISHCIAAIINCAGWPTETQCKYEEENKPPDIKNKFSPGLFTFIPVRHDAFYPVFKADRGPLTAWQALNYRLGLVESSQSGSGRNMKDLLGWSRLYLTTNTVLHHDNMEMSQNICLISLNKSYYI